MSLGARIVLALFAALFGVIMATTAPSGDKAPFFYLFAAFCASISVACIAPGRIAQFFGSLVATGVLLAGVWYLVSMFSSGPIFTGRRSDESLVNSLLFLVVFGIPSAGYLLKARFGFGQKTDFPPLPTSPDDPLMIEALSKAKNSMPQFLSLARKSRENALVKLYFVSDSDTVEHL